MRERSLAFLRIADDRIPRAYTSKYGFPTRLWCQEENNMNEQSTNARFHFENELGKTTNLEGQEDIRPPESEIKH